MTNSIILGIGIMLVVTSALLGIAYLIILLFKILPIGWTEN